MVKTNVTFKHSFLMNGYLQVQFLFKNFSIFLQQKILQFEKSYSELWYDNLLIFSSFLKSGVDLVWMDTFNLVDNLFILPLA